MDLHGGLLPILISVGVTMIVTVGYMWHRTKYLTNNSNATADDFEVFENTACPICLERFNGPDHVVLNCGHLLHPYCLRELENHRMYLSTIKCPTCRTPIRMDY